MRVCFQASRGLVGKTVNIAVEGQKYEGKSTLAFFLACRIKDRTGAYKIWIFDPKWAFRNPSPVCAGKRRVVQFSDDIDEFSDRLTDEGDAIAFRPRISFNEDDSDVVSADFRAFAEAVQLERWLKRPPERPIILLIDEAYHLQDGRWVHSVLAAANRLATQGKVFIIQAVHGPKEIAPMMRRQVDEFYLFRQNDPVDLDAIRERMGEEAMEIVSVLHQHHVLVFKARTRTFEVWTDPKSWYCDISKSPETVNGNAPRLESVAGA